MTDVHIHRSGAHCQQSSLAMEQRAMEATKGKDVRGSVAGWYHYRLHDQDPRLSRDTSGARCESFVAGSPCSSPEVPKPDWQPDDSVSDERNNKSALELLGMQSPPRLTLFLNRFM